MALVGSGRRHRLWSAAGLIAFLALIPVVLLAAQRPAASASTVVTVFTDTVFLASGSNAFAPARDGDVVRAGDRLRTDEHGHALITFFDGSTVEVEPETTLQIDAAATNPNGSITLELSQTIGRTWASVQKLTRLDSKFEIRTPAATAAVRGTAFLTEVLADGETRVETSDGTVEVAALGQSVLVARGQAATVRVNSPPTAPVSMRTPANRLRFGMHSPAYLAAVDPIGRACGLVTPGVVVRQIPGCLVTAPGTEPQLIDVPDPRLGTYRLVVAPIGDGGAFTLTAAAVDDSGAVTFDHSLAGEVRAGAILGSAIDVQVSADGTLAAAGLGALETLSLVPLKVIVPSGATSSGPRSSTTPEILLLLPLPSLPVSATATASPSPASSASPSPSAAPTPSATRPPTPQPTPSDTLTASPSPSPSSSANASPSPSPSPSASPSPSPSPSATPSATASATPEPTATPDPTASPTPTPAPTRTPPPGASVCTIASNGICQRN